MLERIFEPFVRVRPLGRGADGDRGTGLGLAVVRGLVEAVGGQVRARQSRLGGLAIEIDLPAAEVPVELSEAAS
jgi:two-component system sensor histidine kinase KdpD